MTCAKAGIVVVVSRAGFFPRVVHPIRWVSERECCPTVIANMVLIYTVDVNHPPVSIILVLREIMIGVA